MPIYEFACRTCGERFERLLPVRSEPPGCPACGARRARRLISLIGGLGRTSNGTSGARTPAAGGCGCGGACACGA
ncbi:MAG: zinc ribbon domain-containing protein [Actinobacteria bacterium]|nr:zinc ribbon domain-containing protein [Actinomycetota bacterium]